MKFSPPDSDMLRYVALRGRLLDAGVCQWCAFHIAMSVVSGPSPRASRCVSSDGPGICRERGIRVVYGKKGDINR